VTEKINDKGFPNFLRKSLILEQHIDVEKIPRMLPVQSCTGLSSVKILERKSAGFDGKLKEVLCLLTEGSPFGWKCRSPQDKIGFNFDRGVTTAKKQTGYRVELTVLFGECTDTGNCFLDPFQDSQESLADFHQGSLTVIDRKIGQVNVDGKTGKIPEEEVDCGSSLQGKDFLFVYRG
jgi:hypothetical protein